MFTIGYHSRLYVCVWCRCNKSKIKVVISLSLSTPSALLLERHNPNNLFPTHIYMIMIYDGKNKAITGLKKHTDRTGSWVT